MYRCQNRQNNHFILFQNFKIIFVKNLTGTRILYKNGSIILSESPRKQLTFFEQSCEVIWIH